MTTDIADAAPGSKPAMTPAKAEGATTASPKPRTRKARLEHPVVTCEGAPVAPVAPVAGGTIVTNKLDRLAALLADPAGASIAVMMATTGWQAHSVRGAMAGALRKRGNTITSDKVDGVRFYRAGPQA